ncbi:MAG: carbohydrate-binding domain-containing protein [Prevotella sp.]|jgi:hypothetical protein|nr:carbohydrate-binding domain-containing protein [Prevotella sp.]
MKKILFFLPIVLFCCLPISCSSDNFNEEGLNNNEIEEVEDFENVEDIEIPEDFETNTQDVNIENAVSITFGENNTVSITNPYSDQISIVNDGGNLVITSSIIDTEVNYVLSGQTTQGSLKIYSDYKFGLVMNGISIISESGPAINIQSSKKVSVSLTDKTSNRLVDGTTYPENETEDMKAALFSEGQLIFSGNGSLQIIGRNKHSICSDDYVRINEGSITITGSTKDGIHTNDYFEMNGGTLVINSASDGIECEEGYVSINNGSLTIKSSGGDAIKTSYKGDDTSINRNIDISGGNIKITVMGKAAKGIKSKGNIGISGGQLDITTTGNAYYDTDDVDVTSSAGIKADEDMTVSGNSTITIKSTGSGGKGINIDGTLTFNGGVTTVTTTGDQYVYDRNNDTAAKAIKSDDDLTVNSGTIKIKTSKTEAEGLESKATLTINGGNIEIEAYDDCINASDHIEITGGTVYCLSQSNDAIDSNGTLSISGGTVIAIGASAPEEGFDCDNNTFKITGGTIIGLGGSTSSPTSSVSTQRSLVYGANSYEIIHIESASGTEILTFKLPKTFSQTVMLFSSPLMAANTSYTIYTGGSISGGTSTYGLYTGATYTKGNSVGTFTTSSMVNTVGSTGGPGGNPGGGGKPW